MKRFARLFALVVGVLAFYGCEGCQRNDEPPLPVVPEGRLPRVAEALPSAAATVASQPSCVSMMSSDREEGEAPLTVRFTGEGMCTDADGEFTWDFGDATPTVKGALAEHTYLKAGEYNARLVLTDRQHNVSDWDEITIVVTSPES